MRGFLNGHDMHRDVPGGMVCLERVKDRPAVHAREPDVQNDGRWKVFLRQPETRLARGRGQGLEPFCVALVEEDFREIGIIFDNQDDPLAFMELLSVIGDGRGRRGILRHDGRAGGKGNGGIQGDFPLLYRDRPVPVSRLKVQRQEKSENRPFPVAACELNFAAEKFGSCLDMDRPSPVPPYFLVVPPSTC